MKNLKKLTMSLFLTASLSLCAKDEVAPVEAVKAETVVAQAVPVKNIPMPIYKKISQENLKTLIKEDGASDTDTLNSIINDEKEFVEVVREKVEAQFNMDSYTKRQAIFALLNKHEEAHPLPILDVLEDGTWKDLEILCGPKTKPELYVAAKIDRTVTEVGRAMFYRKVIQPTDNADDLNLQQQIIKNLVEDEELFNDLDSNLKKLAVPENVMLSFWGEDILSSLIQQSKFVLPFEKNIAFLKDISSWVNKKEYILMAKSVSRFACFILSLSVLAATTISVPAVAGVDKYGDKIYPNWDTGSFKNILKRLRPFVDRLNAMAPKDIDPLSFEGMVKNSFGLILNDSKYFNNIVRCAAFIFAAHGAWTMFRWLRQGLLLDAMQQKKLIHLATYIDSLNNMIDAVKKHETLCILMPQIARLGEKIEDLRILHDDFDHLLELLDTDTFKGEPSFFSFWSRMDVAYRLMEQEKEKFDEIMMGIGELDAQMSIARLYKDMKGKRVECCFPEYQASTDGLPFIKIKDFWHPCLDTEKVVANSIDLHGTNVVITGPNAGGKSTIMKSLVISIIMAQSLGIAPASSMAFTPFSKIITYMNITDDIAAGNSHFKAGVLRARDVLNEVAKVKEGQHAIAVVDEIFNGTTFKEGQAAAFSFIKQLGQNPSNIIITTTHFPMMSGLAQTNNHFLNYKVYVNYDQNGKIVYPYKLEQGAADQIVTLKILREEGFTDKFIDDAELVLSAA